MKTEKQTYTSPELTELGDVEALTLGDDAGGTDGAGASL
ncbi:MAG: lasso RiPP family leader peptide-containing protein [Limisphaerales bacterium]